MIEPQSPALVVAIVEDDPSLRCALGRLLRAEGFEPVLFDSAEAYISAPPIPAPLCVILDVQLPGMSGLQRQERLRHACDAPPIIITTGGAGVIRDRAERNGCIGFFSKPIDSRALLSTIASLSTKIL
jgi:FixJ family two-component response regulator